MAVRERLSLQGSGSLIVLLSACSREVQPPSWGGRQFVSSMGEGTAPTGTEPTRGNLQSVLARDNARHNRHSLSEPLAPPPRTRCGSPQHP